MRANLTASCALGCNPAWSLSGKAEQLRQIADALLKVVITILSREFLQNGDENLALL
jgi:hypothetical protein